MKKVLLFVMLSAVIGQSYANTAKSNSPVGMSVIQRGTIVKVFYRGEQAGRVKVTIYNEEGDAVFRESITSVEHFMRPYNFSRLPEGNYTIQVSDKKGSRLHKITYDPTTIRVAHLTRLTDSEGKYVLYVPNSGCDKLTVRIYDGGHRLLHRETQSIEGNFARVYNLAEIEGEHVFEIVDQRGYTNRLSKSFR